MQYHAISNWLVWDPGIQKSGGKVTPPVERDNSKRRYLAATSQRGIYGDRLVCQADLKKLRQLTEKISKQMWLEAESEGHLLPRRKYMERNGTYW